LQLTQRELRRKLAARSAKTTAARRYEVGEKYEGALPIARAVTKPEPPPKRDEEPKIEKDKTPTAPTHIQQLLRAKRDAAKRRRNEQTDNEQ